MEKITLQVKDELRGHSSGVCCILYLPDLELIISAGNDRRMIIWDSHDGKKIKVIETQTVVFSILRFDLETVMTLHQVGKTEGLAQNWKLPNFSKDRRYDFGVGGPFQEVNDNEDMSSMPVLSMIMNYFKSYIENQEFRKVSHPYLKFHNNICNPNSDDFRLILMKENHESFTNVIFLKSRVIENGFASVSTQSSDDEKHGTLRLMFWGDTKNTSVNSEPGFGGMISEMQGHDSKILSVVSYLLKPNEQIKSVIVEEGNENEIMEIKEMVITSGEDKKIVFWDIDYLTKVRVEDEDAKIYHYVPRKRRYARLFSDNLYPEKEEDEPETIKSEMFNSLEEATIICDCVQTSLLDWDRTKFLSGGEDGTITIWDIKQKKVIFKLPSIHHGDISKFLGVTCMLWLGEDKRRFVAGSYDGTLKFVDVVDENEVSRRDERERMDYLFSFQSIESGCSSKLFEIKIGVGVWDTQSFSMFFCLLCGL